MDKKGIIINLIGIIILIGLLLFGVSEGEKYVNKIDWEPTVVYEITNKNIEWTH